MNEKTCAVLVSAVLFRTAEIVPHLDTVLEACDRVGAELLVDVYHALNVVPFSLCEKKLQGAFVTGGGYKYCQLGEGNGFLRVPEGKNLRPIITGWFSELSGTLAGEKTSSRVHYPPGGKAFAGATYDPTSHYRAARVLDFFLEQGLTPSLLRTISQHQVRVLLKALQKLDLDPKIAAPHPATKDIENIGGFVALQTPLAAQLRVQLLERGVCTDCRDDILRLGPAPYLSDAQLEDAVGILGEAVEQFLSSATLPVHRI